MQKVLVHIARGGFWAILAFVCMAGALFLGIQSLGNWMGWW